MGSLWRPRRAGSKTRENAREKSATISSSRRHQHLDEATREHLLSAMPQWSFDHRSAAFVCDVPAAEQVLAVLLRRGVSRASQVPLASLGRLVALITAVRVLDDQRITLRVAGLTADEAYVLRPQLPADVFLTPVHSYC